jgi:tight adherence protein B
MEQLIFPMIVAAPVALFVWVVARGIVATVAGGRRRVSQRLSSEGRTLQGDADRKIFVVSEQTGLSRMLTRKSFFQRVQRRLMVVWPAMSVSRFVILSATMGTIALVFCMLLIDSPVVPPAAGLAVAYVPFFMLGSKAAKRNRLLGEQLPEAMDFLGRVLRAGHSLTTGLQMMGTELPEPLAGEFRKCYDQHSLGQPLEACLKELAERVENTEFSFFVTAVLIQRQTGGDLSMILGNISNTVRSRIRLAGFVRAKTAEGRLTGYILVAFPVLMFFVASALSPDYGNKLMHTPTGQKLLATAVGLQIAGLVAIKKLTNVRV